jgi:hypothetical protein
MQDLEIAYGFLQVLHKVLRGYLRSRHMIFHFIPHPINYPVLTI